MNEYSLQELKALSVSEAQGLAEEIRRYLVEHVTVTGGHLASNLGIVEITLGLLRSFSPPYDEILYDTGHQGYVHKLLTGRWEKFETLRQYGGISGFPKRSESEYDAFGAGHSGTAISAALGLARAHAAQSPSPEGRRYTVAVLGDGALTNGMVYEALNNVKPDEQLIIILNDNEMSISKSVGRLSRYLTRVRKSEKYFSLKKTGHRVLDHVPLLGAPIESGLSHMKSGIKSLVYPSPFEQFGVYYLGPANGNDLSEVERLLHEAKGHHGPVLLHLTTKKGKGYAPAEADPGKYHSVASSSSSSSAGGSFSRVFGDTLCDLAARDKKIVAVTAAMERGTGLEAFHRRYPRRFYDVGIAEEHAMTFSAGLSAGGQKPVFAVYSTFFQRAYDQLFHDFALQGLGGVIALDRAGFNDSDGPTHHGLFDVALTLHLPGVRVYSPATYAELSRFLAQAVAEAADTLSVVRYPKGGEKEIISDYFACERELERCDFGEDPTVLLLTYGRITAEAIRASENLKAQGVGVTLVKIGCLKPFDDEGLISLLGDRFYTLCYCLEEGIAHGGFFEGLLARIASSGIQPIANTYRLRAVEDVFVPHGTYAELCRHCAMDCESITKEVLSLL